MQERIITEPDEMEWVTIPAGEFIMGSDAERNCRIKEIDPEFPDEWLAREQPLAYCEWFSQETGVERFAERSISLNMPLQNTR